jgi:hypothetical protein
MTIAGNKKKNTDQLLLRMCDTALIPSTGNPQTFRE